MSQKTLLIILIGLFIVSIGSLYFLMSGDSSILSSNTETVTYTNENASMVITKNTQTKEASIAIDTYVDGGSFKNQYIGDLTRTVTEFTCNIFAIAFFNSTDVEFFEGSIGEDWKVSSSSTTSSKENPLEGYTVNKVSLTFSDIDSKGSISSCTVDGPTKEDITIKVY